MSFNYQQRGKFSLKKGMLGLLVSLSLSGYAVAEYASGGALQIQDGGNDVNGILGTDVTPGNLLAFLTGDNKAYLLEQDLGISSVELNPNSGAAVKKKIVALNNDKVMVLGEQDGAEGKVATLHEVRFSDSGQATHELQIVEDDPISSEGLEDITFGHEHLYAFPSEQGPLYRWKPDLGEVLDGGNLGEFDELVPDGPAAVPTPTGRIAANKDGAEHVYLVRGNDKRSLIALHEGEGGDEDKAVLVGGNATFDLDDLEGDNKIIGSIEEIQTSGDKLYLLMQDDGKRKIVEMDKIGGDNAPNPENTKTLVEGLGANATFSIAPSLGVIYVTNNGNLDVYFDPSGWNDAGRVNLHRYTLQENLDLGADKTLHVQDTLTIMDSDNNGPITITLGGGELDAENINLSAGSAVRINTTVDSNITSPISGAGSLIKTGDNALTLGEAGSEHGQNSYSGDTRIEAGTLVLEDEGASASSTFVLNDGTTLDVAKDSVIKGLASDADGTVNIEAGQTLTLQGTNQPLTYEGTVTGGENLVVARGTQRFTGDVTANTSIEAGGTMELYGNTHTGSIGVSGTLRAFEANVIGDVTLDPGSKVTLVISEDNNGAALIVQNLQGLNTIAQIQVASATGLALPLVGGDDNPREFLLLTADNMGDLAVLQEGLLGQRLLNVAQKVSSVRMEGNNLFITLEEAAALAAGNATGETATYVAALNALADSGNANAERLVQILADKTPAQIEEIVEQFLPRDTAQVSDVSSQASAATRHSIRTHLRNQSQKTTTTRQMNAVSTRAITNQEKDRFVQLVQQASAAPAQGIQKLAAVSASHKGQAVDTLNSRTARLPDELNVSLNRVNVWLQQAIARGDFSKRRHAKAMKSDIYTTTAGIDYRFTDRVLLGVFFGYGKSDFNFAKSQGSGTVKSFSGGLYGSWNPYRTLDVDFSAMIAKHDYRKKRSTVLGNIRSNHDGVEYGLSARASYGFAFWDTGEVRPYVETGVDQLREERYREKGALANTVNKRRSTFWNAGAGVEVSKTYAHKDYMLRPSATVGFIHRNASGDAGRVQYNLGNAAGTYRIKGDSSERNRFLVGANVATLFKNDVYVTVGYNGELSSKDKIHEGLVRVGVTF